VRVRFDRNNLEIAWTRDAKRGGSRYPRTRFAPRR
jgi:hypothetical protein